MLVFDDVVVILKKYKSESMEFMQKKLTKKYQV
jgi:hypothetical protein